MAAQGEQESPQIPQRILVLRDFCIRSANVPCARCASACPAWAISITGKAVAIDADACTFCGICQGICDAFTSTGTKVGDIDAAVMRIALSEPGREAYITCQRCVAESTEAAADAVGIPCLAMIPAELWTKFLARGANVSVAIDLAACEDCPTCTSAGGANTGSSAGADTDGTNGAGGEISDDADSGDAGSGDADPGDAGSGDADPDAANSATVNGSPNDAPPAAPTQGQNAESIYMGAIAQAEIWSGREVGFSEHIPTASEDGLFASLAQAGHSGERRDAFSDILNSLKEASSGALRRRTDPRLRAFIEQNDRNRSRVKLNLGNGQEFNRFTPTGRAKTTMYPRRQMILEAIDADPTIAKRIALIVSRTDLNACEGDLRCARICPTGARRPDPQSGELTFESRLCIGCGACTKVCRHDAIALETATADTLA